MQFAMSTKTLHVHTQSSRCPTKHCDIDQHPTIAANSYIISPLLKPLQIFVRRKMCSFESKQTNLALDCDELLNPYSINHINGQEEGEKVGLQRGFDEGYVLGCKKSWEYHFEVGYYLSFVRDIALEFPISSLKSSITSSSIVTGDTICNLTASIEKSNRIARNILAIIEEIESFPGSDEILGNNGKKEGVVNDTGSLESTVVDVVVIMQRIRAKFKLLLAQLGVQEYSLQKVLDKSTYSSFKSQIKSKRDRKINNDIDF